MSGSPRKRPGKRERQLQKAIVEFHRTAVRYPETALLFGVPNGEKRDPATALMLSGVTEKCRNEMPDEQAMLPFGQGVLPGTSDLVLLTAGTTDFLEVKVEASEPDLFGRKQKAGSQSRYQKLFQTCVTRLGHQYTIIRSVESYQALLVSRGIELRLSCWGNGVVGPVGNTAQKAPGIVPDGSIASEGADTP